MAGIDVSKLTSSLDYSSLLGKNKNVLSDNLLSQWSMLRANGKALKSSLVAEQRGYLRDRDAPAQLLLSEKYLAAADRSTTVADVLKMLGREPTKVTDETASTTDKTETADKTDTTGKTETSDKTEAAGSDKTDTSSGTNGVGGGTDVYA